MIKSEKLNNSPDFSVECLENGKSIVTLGDVTQSFDDHQTGLTIFNQIKKYYVIKGQLKKNDDLLSKKEKKELTAIVNDLEKSINLLKK